LVAAALIPPNHVRFISIDHEISAAGQQSTDIKGMYTPKDPYF
jgi:hypothetical protein